MVKNVPKNHILEDGQLRHVFKKVKHFKSNRLNTF